MSFRWDWQTVRKELGNRTEMIAAEAIRQEIPNGYSVQTNGYRSGPDIKIIEDSTEEIRLIGEVKTAKEFFLHKYLNKKTCQFFSNVRRGMFNVEPHQLDVDFYAFVIRFVDIHPYTQDCAENGEYELFFAKGKDVQEYLLKQTLNCQNYKLCIDKLVPYLNVKRNLLEVVELE